MDQCPFEFTVKVVGLEMVDDLFKALKPVVSESQYESIKQQFKDQCNFDFEEEESK